MSLEKEEQNFRWENLSDVERNCIKGLYKSSQKIKTLCPGNDVTMASRLIKEAFDTTWGEHNILEDEDKDIKKFVIKKYVQTCIACPSQWDLRTDDNKYIYVRYRWGVLTVTLDAFTPEEKIIFRDSFGGEYGGDLSFEELKSRTKDVLDWDGAEETDEDLDNI